MEKNMLTHGLSSQILAALIMLKDCIDRCPDTEWNERHNDYPFSHVVFHTLFDCDYNLSENDAELKDQPFHKENATVFADYEELENRVRRRLYERDFIHRYFEHCRVKVVSVIETKNPADLLIPNSDVYGNMTKLERYVNLVRHLQHHTAQLGLRLQFVTGKEMDWIGRGYET